MTHSPKRIVSARAATAPLEYPLREMRGLLEGEETAGERALLKGPGAGRVSEEAGQWQRAPVRQRPRAPVWAWVAAMETVYVRGRASTRGFQDIEYVYRASSDSRVGLRVYL